MTSKESAQTFSVRESEPKQPKIEKVGFVKGSKARRPAVGKVVIVDNQGVKIPFLGKVVPTEHPTLGTAIAAKKTTPQNPKVELVRHKALWVRSKKGVPLPKAVVERLCALQADNPDFVFKIGSAEGLVREKSFFKKYHHTLQLYDENGQPFDYDGKARPVRENKKFIGVSFSRKRKQATVFAYFPYE